MNKPTPLKVSAPVRTCPAVSTEEIREEERRTEENRNRGRTISSPPPRPLQMELWQILRGGVDSLTENDHGRPWPYPSRSKIKDAIATYDPDICKKAAWEAREIVQAQDRAPNISALFEKKCRDLAEVRETVRESLRAA